MELTEKQRTELERRYEVARGGVGTLSFDKMYEVRHAYFEELRGNSLVQKTVVAVPASKTIIQPIGETNGEV